MTADGAIPEPDPSVAGADGAVGPAYAWSGQTWPAHDWLDEQAGPVVRPYTLTGGRVTPVRGGFDLVAFVVAGPPAVDTSGLQPEHRAIIARAQEPVSVAELASHLDLAVGVVRVLLGDLLQADLIAMYEPPASSRFPDDDILKAVLNGLRAL